MYIVILKTQNSTLSCVSSEQPGPRATLLGWPKSVYYVGTVPILEITRAYGPRPRLWLLIMLKRHRPVLCPRNARFFFLPHCYAQNKASIMCKTTQWTAMGVRERLSGNRCIGICGTSTINKLKICLALTRTRLCLWSWQQQQQRQQQQCFIPSKRLNTFT